MVVLHCNNDVVRRTNGQLELCDLRKLEKMKIRLREAEHNLNFLKTVDTSCYTKILGI